MSPEAFSKVISRGSFGAHRTCAFAIDLTKWVRLFSDISKASTNAMGAEKTHYGRDSRTNLLEKRQRVEDR